MARLDLKRAFGRWLLGVAAALAAIPAVARAEPPVKIGYFDVKRIIQEVDEANEKRRTLEADVKEKQKELDQMKAELEDLQRKYEAEKSVLSPAAREQRETELQQKAVKAQNTYMGLQQELAQKEQQALGDLLGKLEPVVQSVAQANGYTYVFEKNEAGLFYAPAGSDLTAELIRRYNQQYPAHGKAKTKR